MALCEGASLGVAPAPRCLGCGSEALERWAEARDVEYFTSDETFTYRRCGDCGCLSIDPVPDDRLDVIYPSNYYAYVPGGRTLATRLKSALDRRLFRSFLADVAGDTLCALDVGGGRGWLLGALREADPRVGFTQVVDIDPAPRAEAEAAGHAYFAGPLEAFEDARGFDVILLLNILEHVRDPVGLLARARELLRPGGRMLVLTPNHEGLDARLFRHRNWGGYHCPRHWVLFDRAGFEGAASRAGLRVASFRPYTGATFWAWSVMALLHARGWVEVSAARPVAHHPLTPWLSLLFGGLETLAGPLARRSNLLAVLEAA